MKIRPRRLPPGWYPSSESEARETIERYLSEIPEGGKAARAGVAPHAGWEFSGKVALEVLLHFHEPVDTIVVAGGHLSPSAGIIAAFEEAYETPLGPLPADLELLEDIIRQCPVSLREDHQPDNTVEVQLPFIKYLFPESRSVAIRVSASNDSIELGKAIKKAGDRLGRNVVVLGSTDLTHYGSNYGFAPAGRGAEAVEWVKEVNDRGFIDNLLSMNAEEALRHALENKSACSAGGAVAALTFARESGARRGELIRYLTSYDIYPNESFVGYAGVVYGQPE